MEQLSKELGVTTFKLFMSQKGRLMLDNNEMMEAFKHIKDIGGVAKVSFGETAGLRIYAFKKTSW